MTPRISLCMVARNEAAFIGQAIASAQPAVDEVVVVDTGSSDATVSIARDAGATVVQEAWPGDLGAAHDLPVAHAGGDWVLALDADEVLDPSCAARVRELAAAGEHDGYDVQIRNYSYGWDAKWRPADPRDPLACGAAGYIPTRPVRLFRRRAEYRYSGLLHQCVAPAIRGSGGRVGESDIVLHHYGFVRFDRQKSTLYRELATGQALARPDDSRAWVELGVVLLGERSLHSLPAAIRALQRGWALGDRADAAFLLGAALVEHGYPDEAVALLRGSIGANPTDDAGHYDRADAWEELALAYEDLDRPDDAEAAYRAAIAARPDRPTAAHNLAALLLDTGSAHDAAELVDALVDRYRGSSTCWSLLGRVRLRQGDPVGAAAAFRTALDIRPENLGARVGLAVAYRRAGRPRLASRAYAAAADQLGGEHAQRLHLADRLPARHRRRPARRVDDLGPDTVVSLTGSLAGGSGRVLADGVAALAGRPQLVVCEDASTYNRQGLRDELEAAGVRVITIASPGELGLVLRRVRPAVVIHHWYASLVAAALREADARWICVGHAALPMPLGYDAYVVNSAFFRQYQEHLPPERVRFVPNGVDLGRFPPVARRTRSPVTIAMLSRLDVGKFPRRLLDYLPSLEGAQVLIGGYGARRHELEPELRARGLHRAVRFVGPVGGAEVPAFLAGADIGLHLTETHQELCSMTILEMLAAGLPIVAQPRGGIPEMVTDGRNGYLATDARDVARRVRELVDSPSLRSRMGAASRDVAWGFSLDAFASSLRDLVHAVEDGAFDACPVGQRPERRVTTARRPSPIPPRRSYLVCTTVRTGSSLLCELLGGTGLAGYPGELFSPSGRRTLAGMWGTPTIGSYVEELLRRLVTPNGVFGAKVGIPALRDLLAGLRAERDGASAHDLLAAAFPRLGYVWLSRRDRVRQAVSWERAAQTGVWTHTGARPPIAVPRPRFDAAAIHRRLEDIDRDERWWEDLFAAADVEPVRVSYEDLVADGAATVRRVLGGLGIDTDGPLWLPAPHLRRQADARSERWVERYHQASGRRLPLAEAALTPARDRPGAAPPSSRPSAAT